MTVSNITNRILNLTTFIYSSDVYFKRKLFSHVNEYIYSLHRFLARFHAFVRDISSVPQQRHFLTYFIHFLPFLGRGWQCNSVSIHETKGLSVGRPDLLLIVRPIPNLIQMTRKGSLIIDLLDVFYQKKQNEIEIWVSRTTAPNEPSSNAMSLSRTTWKWFYFHAPSKSNDNQLTNMRVSKCQQDFYYILMNLTRRVVNN